LGAAAAATLPAGLACAEANTFTLAGAFTVNDILQGTGGDLRARQFFFQVSPSRGFGHPPSPLRAKASALAVANVAIDN
jgi:hypothetical protein